MDKYKNKYRSQSFRLQSWDYGSNGAYFITICTANRRHFFGKIDDGKMQLNKIGQLAEKYWLEIPDHFPFVKLGNFVVMPNHTHGVIIIDKCDLDGLAVGMLQCNIPTAKPSKNEQMSKISPKPGTISTIIRSYKSVVTKNARKIRADFAWQSLFHDHIIRNTYSFERIQNYILNNPSNWGKDKFKR